MSKQERVVCVQVPNNEQLSVTVGVKALGHELFSCVCEQLSIKDPHFFGLSVLKDNESIFIDLEQKLSKYFSKDWKKESGKGFGKSGPLFCVRFNVQYYVGNGRLISDRTARHLYYCHMKEKVLHSECTHKEEIYFLLAAYALQVDLGNYKATVHIGKYFEPEAYFPRWIILKRGCDYILKHTPKIHSDQQGRTVKEALLRFIKESCLLEDVPVHYYRLHKDKKEVNASILLGLTLKGLHIYQDLNNRCELLYDFPWSNVGRLTFLGKKFEILPDGLPSARKLVYYTGCPFRSRHLLHHLSNTHRLYLNIQPVLKHIRKIEEAEEKKCYRESYISDTLEMDLEPLDKQSKDSRSSQGSNRNHRVSLQSISSHGSSGIEADSRHQMSVEMTVDEPFSLEPTHKSMKSFSSVISHGSSHTSGIEMCSKDRTEDDLQDDEVELAVDGPQEPVADEQFKMSQLSEQMTEASVDPPELPQEFSWKETLCKPVIHEAQVTISAESLKQAEKSKPKSSPDRHSQSLDDIRLFQQETPLSSCLNSETSQSYTFGIKKQHEKDNQYGCTYSTVDCETRSTFYGKRSMNCLSLDLLGEENFLEFVV
ncbi:FERM domain-containing protein 6-like [Polypterus senegalus]|uniref:FERM domain-containing protein 6-like n=1 Tax=Polypterus senegalus TaxID=55291 RepID=UPI0019645E77|nr:FERM domain-containing protein 6-like [Polypterus senegalus]XP_039594465.1 FERM domain-containing protein 6-like [Polypterus senegalus]